MPSFFFRPHPNAPLPTPQSVGWLKSWFLTKKGAQHNLSDHVVNNANWDIGVLVYLHWKTSSLVWFFIHFQCYSMLCYINIAYIFSRILAGQLGQPGAQPSQLRPAWILHLVILLSSITVDQRKIENQHPLRFYTPKIFYLSTKLVYYNLTNW